MSDTTQIMLERPTFGQFARQVASIKADDLEACLQEQRQTGGRLGVILRQYGLLSDQQIQEILHLQATWVANTLKPELGGELPYKAFLSLCMPAYNEAANIADTIETALIMLPLFVGEFEIIIVDDGSRDTTAEVVERYSRIDARVRLVRHPHNRGYGAAVTSGLRAARGNLIMFTDSDGQFSFLDLPHLLSRLEGQDMVIGYRYRRADHWTRLLNARMWGWLVRLLLGVRVRDLDCAFKLFRREVLDNLHLTSTGAAINAEIMVQCTHGQYRMCEIPVNHYPRYAGAPTGAALKVIARAFRELPGMWKYRFGFAPATQSPAAQNQPATGQTLVPSLSSGS